MNESPKKKCKMEESLEKLEKSVHGCDIVNVGPTDLTKIRESFNDLQESVKEYVELNSSRARQEIQQFTITYCNQLRSEEEKREEEKRGCNRCNACGAEVYANNAEGLKFADNKWYCTGCCQTQVNILVRENDLLDPCLLIEMGYREVNTGEVIDPPDPDYWKNYNPEKPKTGNPKFWIKKVNPKGGFNWLYQERCGADKNRKSKRPKSTRLRKRKAELLKLKEFENDRKTEDKTDWAAELEKRNELGFI